MTPLEKAASRWTPDLCRISVHSATGEIGAGTAFVCAHGLISNSHTVQAVAGTTFIVQRGSSTWSMTAEELRSRIVAESREDAHDYALISLYQAPRGFEPSGVRLARPQVPPVGRQVAYLGYPFGSSSLVVSTGYVSSLEAKPSGVVVLRIDGSVNRGNSGGPVIDLATGQVIALIARAETGFVMQHFRELQEALASNIQLLEKTQAVIQVGGIDPIQVSRATMVAIAQVTHLIERSANVGIGYAMGLGALADVIARHEAD